MSSHLLCDSAQSLVINCIHPSSPKDCVTWCVVAVLVQPSIHYDASNMTMTLKNEFNFMCMNGLSACMYVHLVIQCPQRPEEGIRIFKQEFRGGC